VGGKRGTKKRRKIARRRRNKTGREQATAKAERGDFQLEEKS